MQPKLFGGCSTSKVLQNSGTRLPQLVNTSELVNTNGFHQNVGEGNKSLNAMSPDPFLSIALVKGLAERDYTNGWFGVPYVPKRVGGKNLQ